MTHKRHSVSPKVKQDLKGHNKQSFSGPEVSNGLRYIEQYAQAIIVAQPLPPRRLKTWVIILRQIAPNTALSLLVLLVIVIAEEFVNRQVPIWDRSLGFFVMSILLLVALPSVLYSDVFKPMHQWWYGLRFGQYTVAHITNIQQRKLHYGDIFEGHWQFVVNNVTVTTPFHVSSLRSGPWVWQLEAGSYVHVLVHPAEPRVLVELGIVDESSPMLNRATTTPLLAELLAREATKDSL